MRKRLLIQVILVTAPALLAAYAGYPTISQADVPTVRPVSFLWQVLLTGRVWR